MVQLSRLLFVAIGISGALAVPITQDDSTPDNGAVDPMLFPQVLSTSNSHFITRDGPQTGSQGWGPSLPSGLLSSLDPNNDKGSGSHSDLIQKIGKELGPLGTKDYWKNPGDAIGKAFKAVGDLIPDLITAATSLGQT